MSNFIYQFESHIQSYKNKWFTLETSPVVRPKQSFMHQFLSYYHARKCIKALMKKCQGYQSLSQLKHLKSDQVVDDLLKLWFQMDYKALDETVRGDYIAATEQFIDRAKHDFPEMKEDSIYQALRNVWIMIAIQMITAMPVHLTDAMYAYSMLYPLTDNVLDDPELNEQDKKGFVQYVGERLKGSIKAKHPHTQSVDQMIGLIEAQYDRYEYPEVYESLLQIHRDQKKSLAQQYDLLSEGQILDISFRKGASSVLADGFLVCGSLDDHLFHFLTGYGIVLQLADDLQDMTTDREANHMTLFSSEASPYMLEHKVDQLIALSREIMLSKGKAEVMTLNTLLDRSLTLLIDDALILHRRYFSNIYIHDKSRRHLTGYWGFKKLKAHLMKMSHNLNINYTN